MHKRRSSSAAWKCHAIRRVLGGGGGGGRWAHILLSSSSVVAATTAATTATSGTIVAAGTAAGGFVVLWHSDIHIQPLRYLVDLFHFSNSHLQTATTKTETTVEQQSQLFHFNNEDLLPGRGLALLLLHKERQSWMATTVLIQ